MAMQINSTQDLILQLFKIGAIAAGDFQEADGATIPIQFDLRKIISYPELYQFIIDLFAEKMGNKQFDHLAGVPYSALPLASGIAVLYQKSMIMPRKAEDGNTIEGAFSAGEQALVIEDMVASGGSALHTIQTLSNSGLSVQDVLVFLDRQQGAKERLIKQGINLHAICTLSDALETLQTAGLIDETSVAKISEFIKEHQF